jgi:hypothetical protein
VVVVVRGGGGGGGGGGCLILDCQFWLVWSLSGVVVVVVAAVMVG